MKMELTEARTGIGAATDHILYVEQYSGHWAGEAWFTRHEVNPNGKHDWEREYWAVHRSLADAERYRETQSIYPSLPVTAVQLPERVWR